jgi:hypothetical protein
MSRPVDSMMQARRGAPAALGHAQQRLAAAAWPSLAAPGGRPHPHWSARPALRAGEMSALLMHQALVQGQTAARVAQAWPALASDPVTAGEAWAMGWAVAEQWRRWLEQGTSGLADWLDEMGQYRRADTLSKALDQEFNLLQQVAALATTQATSALQLIENLQIGTAWWLTRRTESVAGESAGDTA